MYGYKATPSRPNHNVFLNVMRDGDMGDMWGTAMAYGFAMCDMMYDKGLGYLIPNSLGYRPAMGGADTEAYEWFEVNSQFAWLKDLYGQDVALAQAVFALRCLDRLLDWLKDAGKDY